MEQNQFDLLNEIEKDIEVKEEPKKELKEYEKLLLLERNRKDYNKALNLIKFGCFEQKQEATIDFNVLERITYKKKYKGLYELYRNVDTMQLQFICPLVEDNKGDVDERKDLKPYAYDVIFLEIMDNETYEMVSKAAKNNIHNIVGFAYVSSFVLYFAHIIITLSMFIYNLIANSTQKVSFLNNLLSSVSSVVVYFISIIIAAPLLVLMMIKYRKYKAE